MTEAAEAAPAVEGDGSKTIFVLIGRLAKLVVPYRPRVVLVAIGLAFEMAFASALPFSFKFIIDDGLIGGDHDLLMAIIVGLGRRRRRGLGDRPRPATSCSRSWRRRCWATFAFACSRSCSGSPWTSTRARASATCSAASPATSARSRRR